MLKLVFCRHFRVLKNEAKKLCTRPRLGQLENGLFDILWATLVGVKNGKFENLRDFKTQNQPKTRLRDLTFEIGQKFF